MGGSSQPFLVSLNNFLENKRNNIITSKQRVSAHGIKGRHVKLINKRCRRMNMMKRRRRSRRNIGEVERKVRTLKKLVPNSSDTMGLDGLFRETADYILALQIRVRVMQFMVKGLSSSIDSANINE